MTSRFQRHLAGLIAVTTLLGALGCGQAAPGTGNSNLLAERAIPTEVQQAKPLGAPARMGKVIVVLNWPEVRALATKVFPDSSSTVTITASAADIPTPVSQTVSRPTNGWTTTTVTLTVPTGTGRSITAVASNGSGTTARATATGVTIGSDSNSSLSLTMDSLTTPVVFDLSPVSGGAGTTVTLYGAHLLPPGATPPSFSSPNPGNTAWNVTFGGTAATISSWTQGTTSTPDSIVCTVPTGATANHIVATADGVSSSELTISATDSYTSLLLHGNGLNGGTLFTDWSTANSKTITKYGGVTTSSTQAKFGGSSIYLDGANGSYLTGGTSSDFAFGTGDFTIDFWIYPSAFTLYPMYLYETNTGNQFRPGAVGLYIAGDTQGKLRMVSEWGDPGLTSQQLTANAWNHVAFVRSGTTIYFFINGVKDSFQPTFNHDLTAGGSTIGTEAYDHSYGFPGYIDELRVSKGIARWTANFTPPTQAY